jgi:alpha-beta hydrolase superfamily lysophospholipase
MLPTMRRRTVIGTLLAGSTLVMVGLPIALAWYRLHPLRTVIADDPGQLGLAYESVEFASAIDGTTLRGWYLPAASPSGRTIVVAPGIDDDRRVNGVTLRLAPALLAAGFDILAFDLRGEGASGGDGITLGAREQWDVIGAVREAQRRGARHVGVLGFSLGAASGILAAAHEPDIAALVAEAPFADLEATLRHQLQERDHLPPPLASYGLWLLGVMSGEDLAAVSPVEAIGRIAPRPVLLIAGTADETVTIADSDALFAAASPGSVERWIVPGGGHAIAYEADPDGYAGRVVGFFEAALPSR